MKAFLKKNSAILLVLGLILAILPFLLQSNITLYLKVGLWLLGSALVLYYLYRTIYPSHDLKVQVAKVLGLILLLALVVFVMREAGITFSAAEPIVTFGIGQSFTCPINANWYGQPGCEVYYLFTDANGFIQAPLHYNGWAGLLQPGGTFTCAQAYSTSNEPIYENCFTQFEVPATPTTVTTTFSEVGLPSYQQWSVIYDGMQNSNIGGSITFQTNPGSYSYDVFPEYGYYIYPSSGTLQAGSSITIQFSTSSQPPPNSTGTGTGTGNTQPSQIIGTVSVHFLGAIVNDLIASFIPIGR